MINQEELVAANKFVGEVEKSDADNESDALKNTSGELSQKGNFLLEKYRYYLVTTILLLAKKICLTSGHDSDNKDYSQVMYIERCKLLASFFETLKMDNFVEIHYPIVEKVFMELLENKKIEEISINLSFYAEWVKINGIQLYKITF